MGCRLFLCIAALFLAVSLSLSVSAQATCDPCTNCSADPVFIQKDSRNPELVLLTRNLKKIGIDVKDIDTIAITEAGAGKRIHILIFQEDGKRVEAEIARLEVLDAAVVAYLRLHETPAASAPKTGPALVDPKAFLRGE